MQDLSKRGWAFVLCLCLAGLASAQEEDSKAEKKKPDFPPFDEVAKDYEKVVSTVDEEPSLYTLWIRKKDGQMLAELPRGYERQRHYIALTTPTGETFAGLQSSERYVYWRRYDKRVALIELNIDTRSTGDVESRDSIRRHITDQVLVDVPIACMGENGQPVIDMDDLFVENASTFYEQAGGLKKNLATIAKAKAFPENIEVAFEVPDRSGEVKTFYYSLSRIPDGTDYEPREADDRVGFFTTVYRDLGKFKRDDVWVRYVNRWKLEKADPKLKLSPPKEPIVYYIEHTVPVRYRRYVKQGVLAWNAAFEKVGISDAIVVQYQDKSTGANMDKDPEDVRYNFVRWLSNDVGTAIGPSRAHPVTGQILDADIVLTDGWIRALLVPGQRVAAQTWPWKASARRPSPGSTSTRTGTRACAWLRLQRREHPRPAKARRRALGGHRSPGTCSQGTAAHGRRTTFAGWRPTRASGLGAVPRLARQGAEHVADAPDLRGPRPARGRGRRQRRRERTRTETREARRRKRPTRSTAFRSGSSVPRSRSS